MLAAVVLLASLGWLSADWRAENADMKIRESLLFQAVLISKAIDPELVKKLTFTAADKGTPAFERIREQMIAYGQLITQRGIYSLALHDDVLIFGPENYPEDDPMASFPGTIYHEPSPEDYEAFSIKKPIALGPITDEYGTFISALAPVYDPRTGKVLMVVGIDFLSDDWQLAVNAARRGPLAITSIIILVLLVGTVIIYRRKRLPEKTRILFRHIETIMAGLLGFILTVSAILLAYEAESREQLGSFIRTSYAVAEAAGETFRGIKGNVAAIARFKEGSDHINKQEFVVFAEPMTRTSAIRGYQLVSSVPAVNKTAFEADIRNNGVEGFFVWKRMSQGKQIPVSEPATYYYPVCYVVPWNDNKSIVGFDLGSVSQVHAALEESVRTGLITATGAVNLVQDNAEDSSMLIFYPILEKRLPFNFSQQDRESGTQVISLAGGIIRMESIMDVVLKKYLNEESTVNMHLVDLVDERGPTILATCPHHETNKESLVIDEKYLNPHKYVMSFPVFVFGRPLAMVSYTTNTCLMNLKETRLVGFAGFFLTTVLTLFIGLSRNQYGDLEFQIQMRNEALGEIENRFQVLFENAISGVALHEIVLDEKGNPVDYIFLQVNPGFEKHTGLQIADVLGKRATDVFTGIEKIPFTDIYGKVALTGESITFEQFFPPLQRYFIINAYQVGKGRFATIFLDITQQKRSEEEKNRLQAQLAQAQKMEAVGRLAGGVAHDFNNMLSVIIGFTEMASEKPAMSDPIQEDLKEVLYAAKRSSELVRQLMAFARKQLVNPVVLDLNDCVSGMLKMLRRLIGEDIDLVWIPGDALWSVKIDPSQVDQFLANLMVNARDAIEGTGKVTIETTNVFIDQDYCRVHAGSVPGEYVLLAVSDNGCGMDKEIQTNIFEPFFTTKDIGKGTGLGLSTVFGIVKQNKGYINVYSEPGQGTTFRIYFPRFVGNPISDETIEVLKKPVKGSGTILLVEDEEAVLKLAKTMLQRLGYAVLTAGKPVEAINLAAEYAGDINLLITDVVMPEMNGVRLAEKLTSFRPGIKCLYMSGYTANLIVHLGILKKGAHLVQKPFSFNILADKVCDALK
jgi:signal transduction histidine kinase/CHASE1-domain containing sensor protein/CheY-like chemotaxis protein